ncbi:MAG: alpha/beta fold hydrolase [Anaerolineales bacterium]
MERLVAFQNQGQNLYGMLHLPQGPGPHPAVALLHGFTGHRSESHFIFTKQARHLARHGIAALRFDFRGSGESEGDFADMTIEGEISDAAAALDWLSAQPEIDKARLGVLGLSLGGLVAACLAGRDPRVRALVLWAAPANLAEVLTKGAETAPRPPVPQPKGLDIGGLVVGHEFIRQVMTVRPLDEIRHFTGPTLVVQGTADQSVPPKDAHEYMNALTGPKSLLLVNGADHTFSSVAWEEEVMTASTNWFAQHL